MALRLLCLLAACLACASGFAAPLSRAAVQPRSSEVCMTTAASKATRVNRRNREYNKQYKSEMRTRIKRVRGRCRFFAAFFSSRSAFREAAFSAFPDTLTLARCFLFSQVLESVEEGDYQVALPTLSKAFAIIDKNVKRGIVHKNTAARKKSQLHLKVKKLEVRVPGELPPANLRALCL